MRVIVLVLGLLLAPSATRPVGRRGEAYGEPPSSTPLVRAPVP